MQKDQTTKTGDARNADERVRDMIRSDRACLSDEKALLAELRAAKASGISDQTLPGIMREVKARLKAEGRL
jgi:hypothetical protein